MDYIVMVANNLETLIRCKEDMKTAIEERGITITGGLSTYADLIYEINSKKYIPSYMTVEDSNVTNFDNITFENRTNCNRLFADCLYLEECPKIDISNSNSINWMFYNCQQLTSIYQYNTSNVERMGSTFNNCVRVVSIPLLDAGKIEYVNNCFEGCKELTDFGGLKDLGKVEKMINAYAYNDWEEHDYNAILDLYDCSKLTRDSILNVFNNLYDRATAGYSILRVNLNENSLEKLSDIDIAIATNKGWNIVCNSII